MKLARPINEIRSALLEQVALLQSYCDHYDAGAEMYCKPMATTLRTLLHHEKTSSSLLQQLGLRSGRFFSMAPPLNPRNRLTECNLVYLRFEAGKAAYLPQLEALPGARRKPFSEWWISPIVKGKGGVTLSRMQIVRAVTDQDGGAHVDPKITPTYAAFRSGEVLGWALSTDGADPDLVHSPQYACIRTIAHETLLTLKQYAPWCFPPARA